MAFAFITVQHPLSIFSRIISQPCDKNILLWKGGNEGGEVSVLQSSKEKRAF
jgi:hypothetical protein